MVFDRRNGGVCPVHSVDGNEMEKYCPGKRAADDEVYLRVGADRHRLFPDDSHGARLWAECFTLLCDVLSCPCRLCRGLCWPGRFLCGDTNLATGIQDAA